MNPSPPPGRVPRRYPLARLEIDDVDALALDDTEDTVDAADTRSPSAAALESLRLDALACAADRRSGRHARHERRFGRRQFDDVAFEELVERARLGDPAAFNVLASAFSAPLVRYTASILSGDFDAAHDVVQEVLLAAWRSLPELAEPRFLRAWLFRVAHRRAVSALRHRRSRGARLCRIEERGVDGCALPARPEPASSVGEAEAARGMRRMLGDIPSRYASPIALCYLEGLGLRETARVLDLSLSTLKMRLHRGRWLLRRRLLVEEEWVPHAWRHPLGRRAARREDMP